MYIFTSISDKHFEKGKKKKKKKKPHRKEGRKLSYLTTHSTHLVLRLYGVTVTDLLSDRPTYRIAHTTAFVTLYRALAGTRNTSMYPP